LLEHQRLAALDRQRQITHRVAGGVTAAKRNRQIVDREHALRRQGVDKRMAVVR